MSTHCLNVMLFPLSSLEANNTNHIVTVEKVRNFIVQRLFINYSSSSLRLAAQWSKQSSSMRLWTQISGTVWRKKFKPRPMFLGSMIFSWNRILGSSLLTSSYQLLTVHSQTPVFSKDHSLNPVQKRKMPRTKILTIWTSVTTNNNKKRISA